MYEATNVIEAGPGAFVRDRDPHDTAEKRFRKALDDLEKVGVPIERAKADLKINQAAKKADLGLIPLKALFGAARVFSYGAKKYAEGNFYEAFLEDGAGRRYISALLRHGAEMQEPNGLHTPSSLAERDEESGLPHIDHAICGLLMLRSIMTKCGALPADPGV